MYVLLKLEVYLFLIKIIMQNNTVPILPKVVPCESKSITLPIINCSHWSIDSECNSICALNLTENPDYKFCINCTSRNPLQDILEKPQILKSKIPNEDIIKEHLEKNYKKIEEAKKLFLNDKNKIKEKSFLEKTTTYLKAESSQATQGKISKENFEKRKEICLKCEYRANDIVQKNGQPLHDIIGWCKGGCGCTVGNPRAALSEKLYMPTLRCPKGKFAEEKGEGFKVEDTIDSVKGIIKSVKNLLGKEPSNK